MSGDPSTLGRPPVAAAPVTAQETAPVPAAVTTPTPTPSARSAAPTTPSSRPQRVAPTSLTEIVRSDGNGGFTVLVAGVVTASSRRGSSRPEPMVTGVTLRAADVRPGDLFAALPGARTHGADFAAEAVARGAVAVLTDAGGAARAEMADVPVLVHPRPRDVLGAVAARVYGDPTARLSVLGVTGTSGKTTVAHLLEAGLAAAGRRTGLIGTVGIRVGDRPLPSAFTTPEAPELQALFAAMLEAGVRDVAMEVSSHALALRRVAGTRFAVAAFTNLSQDHLDFHGDMDEYFAAKAALFDGRARHAVVCVDDAWGVRLAARTPGAITVASAGQSDPAGQHSARRDSAGHTADWRAADRVTQADGAQRFTALTPDGPVPVRLRLPGAFNVANALVALASLAAVGVAPAVAAERFAEVTVPGRMQRIALGQPFLAVVDYAHKPAAVAALLDTLRAQIPGRLITVLGCGGDRDRGKRPLMGAAAARRSDVLVVTDDNPRSEAPAQIRAAMLAGARDEPGRGEVHEIGDRRAAIAAAVAAACPGDAVVVAGKGHETGQEIDGVRHPFDDAAELAAVLAAAGWGARSGTPSGTLADALRTARP